MSTTRTGDQSQDGNRGRYTWDEIQQQPSLWPTTAMRVGQASARLRLPSRLRNARVVITGAGTSGYAAAAIAAAWPEALAVATTDLLVATERYMETATILISLARSGNSPESMGVVERVHRLRPDVSQLAVTCNAEGALATSPLVDSIVLDPRTNDQSLVMTSSFSNLLLAGLCLAKGNLDSVIAAAGAAAQSKLSHIVDAMRDISNHAGDRVVLLASAPLFAWAQEGALKVLEMTAGSVTPLAETYLGLRHGPMSFVGPRTLVICLLSNKREVRRYEEDLVRELRDKKLGHLIGICDDRYDPASPALFDEVVPSLAPQADDDVRAPFEILCLQLFGYNLSLRAGLNPDNPSPAGVINRVVKGVRIYE